MARDDLPRPSSSRARRSVAAAGALCRIVPPAPDAMPVLEAAFRPPPGQKIEPLEARTAIRAAAALGPAAKPLVRPLAKVLMIKGGSAWPARGQFAEKLLVTGSSFGRVRRMKRVALDTLAAVGPGASAAKNVLVWLLEKHDDPVIRYRAARALRRIGD